MGFVAVKPGSPWQVNWDEVNRIVVAFAYMKALIQGATLDTEKQSFLGSMKVVNFDPKKVKAAQQQNINNTIPWVVYKISNRPEEAQNVLARLIRATDALREERNKLFGTAEKSFAGYDRWTGCALAGMQATRDLGFATVAIIGAPVGGTVALTAAAVSATGAAWGKYTDTGNKNAAVLAGVGSLVMCGASAVQNIAKATGAAKGILIAGGVLMDTIFEGAGAAVQGKSGGEVLKSALLKGITAGLGTAVDATKIGSHIDDVLEEIEHTIWTTVTKEHMGKTGLEATKKAIETGTNYAADNYSGSGAKETLKNPTNADEQYVKRNVLKRG